MLTLTSPVKTPLHRLPAALKLGLLALFTLALFQLQDPRWLAAALLLVAFLYAIGGAHFARHGARMLRPILPFVAVVAVWHLIIHQPLQGSAILLRMLTAVAAANLVTMTTRLSDMITVLEWLARPFAKILPPRRLALALALVIRFIPVLSARGQELSLAYRARSAHKRAGLRVIAPLALAALDDADHVAEALRARGGAG